LNRVLRQHGFSLVEVMVAVAILAICVLPLAEALRNGLAAPSVAAGKARELRCMKDTMETVLAQPYYLLAGAAAGKDTASTYSLPQDATCPLRNVFIAKYEDEYSKDPVFLDASAGAARLDAALLYITVSSPASGYSFTTLVAR
jgi:prepilin-type N-terminal cleavage/methylation domain-containing protein